MEKNSWKNLIRHPEHSMNIDGIKITVLDGVFAPDPEQTYSSSIILNNFPNVAGKKVLDVGSGTGLLAIKSSKEGCKEIVATDISPEAIENIKINMQQNNIENITVIETNLADSINTEFDIIFANLPIEGSLWSLDQNNLMSEFFESISDNWKESTWIYIPWGSFREKDRKYIETIFKDHGWNYKIIEEDELDHTWYLYVLSHV